MEIKYKVNSHSLTIYIYGELDEYSASSARGLIDKLLLNNANAKKVIFDLSGITFMDSTGIGLLIGRYKKLKQINLPSYITGVSMNTDKVLGLSGIYNIMPKI